MHLDRSLLEARIAKERVRLLARTLGRTAPIAIEAAELPGEPEPFHVATSRRFTPVAVGDTWGRRWGTTWFRIRAERPDPWAGRGELVLDLGFHARSTGFQCEALVRSIDGSPVQGVHPNRMSVPVELLGPGPAIECYVEAAGNPSPRDLIPSVQGDSQTPGRLHLYRIVRAELAERDDDVVGLVHDLDVLHGVMHSLAPDDPRRDRLLVQMIGALDLLDPIDTALDVGPARERLGEALAVPARRSAHRLVAVGHAHIDTAWLWPMRETVRKCTRTFASALAQIDATPDYRFACSQAAQYAWIQDREPATFERIRRAVADGRWLPVGGMWVEPDMNLPSGESIVRQLVHGQRAFEHWFGRPCREVWIPDVFGYPASLPQLFAQAGCDRFVTQKLSWNKQNRMPHHTFWWQGLDGTRVLTHFPPVDTYNAEMTPAENARASANFRDHGWSDWSLLPYGYGNGGGGPTREMVERARRLADLDGTPRVELGTVDSFFERVEADAERAGGSVPVWVGELYFEMHRGTYTSQARTKSANSAAERGLATVELLAALRAGEGSDAPGLDAAALARELDVTWKSVLVHQFHDILPGSSIGWVHQEAEAVLGDVVARLDHLADRLLDEHADRVGGPVVVSTRTTATDEVELLQFAPLVGPVQPLADGRFAARLAVQGLAVGPAVASPPAAAVGCSSRHLDNGLLRVEIDEHGRLGRVRDLVRGRDLFRVAEPGAVLLVAPDQPIEYDAWDLEAWARDAARPIDAVESIAVVDDGPLSAAVEVRRRFGASTASVTYRVRAGSPRLDLRVEVDWRERECVLTMAFPLDVHADDATCGIQFGHVRRPTHGSTTWDAAKFEVCAHGFVDLSEPSFGVAVLTPDRYGFDVRRPGLRVTLLRAPAYPDPTADAGTHRVDIALFPHGPGLADVVREAEVLAAPLRIRPAAGRPAAAATSDRGNGIGLRVSGRGVQVSALKPADDGSGDIVVRCAELLGDRVDATIEGHIAAAWRARPTEEPIELLGVVATDDDSLAELHVALRPCEVVTLRLRPTQAQR